MSSEKPYVKKINGEWHRWQDWESFEGDEDGGWQRMSEEEIAEAKKERKMMVARDKAEGFGEKVKGIFKKEKPHTSEKPHHDDNEPWILDSEE